MSAQPKEDPCATLDEYYDILLNDDIKYEPSGGQMMPRLDLGEHTSAGRKLFLWP